MSRPPQEGKPPQTPDEIAEYPAPHERPRDGIGEEDNKVPLWFNVAFLGTIVWAVFYVPYYTLSGWSQETQYAAQVVVAEEKAAAVKAQLPSENPYAGDPQAIAEGKQTFEQICAACHKPDGTGLVGPSLVDPYWKYGSTDEERFTSVSEGRPGGMPPWGAQLGTEKIWKALAYVDTLPRTEEPGVGAPSFAQGSQAAP